MLRHIALAVLGTLLFPFLLAGDGKDKMEKLILFLGGLIATVLLFPVFLVITFVELREKENKTIGDNTSGIFDGEEEKMIGMDIEFEVKDKEGRILYVDDKLANGYSIGHDEGTLELRPDPAKDPQELVENLRKLIEKFHTTYPELILSVKDTKYALGGHLHFSFTEKDWKEKGESFFKACEYAIGDTFWLSGELRKDQELWQDIGEYNIHPKTFEYKKSPSAIAYHPEFLLLTLKLVKHWIEREIPQDQDLLTKLSPLTQQERSEYLRLFHVYKTNDISDKVIDFWLYNSPVPEPKLKIDFHLSKSWDEQVKEDIMSALDCYNLYVFIDLLPGKEKRANIKIDGYEKIESLEVKCPVFPYVKLPAFLRKKENWLKERERVLPALAQYCKNFHDLMSDFALNVSLLNR